MKRFLAAIMFSTPRQILTMLIVLSASTYMSGSKGAELTADGIWELADHSGRPQGWFRIAEQNGVYEGQIVKTFPDAGEEPAAERCTRCEGDQKNAPVLGLVFIKGMQRKGLAYEGGRILNPHDGAEYRARMDLSGDGKNLSVRGYLAIETLGQTQVWRRVPASAETAKLLARNFGKRN
ncbi:DUF2147 domain-containing protein [Rhodopseudomonas palustris]|uniref:DUF2147 domain-containing protein n=1 Tax=Rhodopseudomonas palustris TaxID=1076 RepID=UPI0020CC1983|nr:DUF2147 domain-containing protein [Rhodopseudomonas palustris]